MAQQEEPLYDFPEPAQPSKCKFLGHQRGRGSLKSISVLDRLLLTGPVWLQLSINPATALHILQREPPGVSRHTHSVFLFCLSFLLYCSNRNNSEEVVVKLSKILKWLSFLGLPIPYLSVFFLKFTKNIIIISTLFLLMPQTFLVRRSRTSQTNVLCVRLADDSMPSFVQQFGIREDGASKSCSYY